MFGKSLVVDMIDRSAENATDRRRFLRSAGLMGMGVLGAGAVGTAVAGPAAAADEAEEGPSDSAILNFALNLEYLEAEFYSQAAFGTSLPDELTRGVGGRGAVYAGRQVPFETKLVRQYAEEIAGDEINHVRFLRGALGSAAVARPSIDLNQSFTAAARAAGLVGPDQMFDPFANENNFLLAAYIFEDVGVTAYKGAAPLIDNATFVEAAAGILAVEAYHAATIRTVLLSRDLGEATNKISDARDSLDGSSDLDQGTLSADGTANLVPTDENSIVFSRTPGQVLNIVYLNPASVTSGGFFPRGIGGELNTSAASA